MSTSELATGGSCNLWCLKLIRLLQYHSFLTCRYPSVELNKFKAQKDEKYLQNFERISSHKYGVYSLIQIILAFIAAVRYIYKPIATLSLVDHYNPSQSIRYIGNGTFEFACLSTNCTYFTKGDSSFDILELPLSSLCRPELDVIFPSVDPTGYPGLMLSSILALTVFLLNTFALVNFLKPKSTEFLLFITNPHSVIKLMVLPRIKKILSEYSESYMNFQGNFLFGCKFDRSNRLLKSNVLSDLSFNNEKSRFSRLEVKEFVPNYRTIWWQNHMVTIATFIFIRQIIVESSMTITFLLWIVHRIDRRNDINSSFNVKMIQNSCSIWLTDELENQRTPIHLREDISLMDFAQELSGWLDAAILIYCFTSINHLFSYTELSWYELSFWMNDLHQSMLLAIEVGEMTNSSGVCLYDINAGDFLAQLRGMFRENNSLSNILKLRIKNLSLEGQRLKGQLGQKITNQMLIVKYMEAHSRLELDRRFQVELMERMYVELRLYVEQFGQHNINLTSLLIYSYAANYAIVVLIIIADRMVRNCTLILLICLALAWTFSLVNLIAVSTLHAKVS